MRRQFFLISFIFAAISASHAQTSFPMLCAAYPLAVQRGASADVRVMAGGDGGNNLYGAYQALFDDSGISAAIVPPAKGWPPKDAKNPWAIPNVSEVTMHVTISPNTSLGLHEFRLLTPRFGISTVGQLYVSAQPVTLQKEPNNDLQHAQLLKVPGDLDGIFRDSVQVHHYRFHADTGQQFTFTIVCARAEDKIHDLQQHADPVITLCDAKGVELAQNDDYYGADSLLHYQFKTSGDYILKLRDVNYQGNPFWVYHLQISDKPYVTATVPCALTPGQTTQVQVYGYNLQSVQKVSVTIPSNQPSGIWRMQLQLPGGKSNPVPFLITHTPQTSDISAGPVSGLRTASLPSSPSRNLTLPGGVNSWIASPGTVDKYTFIARKGAAWGFETTAWRIDSRMDTEIRLVDDTGKTLAENDDTYGKDSRIDWTAPNDGRYTLEVRDLTGQYGPDCYYNLTARPLTPNFTLRVDPDRGMIAPGNKTAWFVLLERKYGFDGPVEVHVDGLPPDITATALTIPQGMGQGVVVFSASSGAKIEGGLLRVFGTAEIPGSDGKMQMVAHQAQNQTEIYMPGGGRGLYPVDTAGISVTEPNDIESVSLSSSNINIVQGGTSQITVTIKRRSDFTKDVTLDLRVNHQGGIFTDPLPPGVTTQDAITIPGGKDQGVITLKAAPNARIIQNWPLAVMANVRINFVMKVWYAAPLTLSVTEAPKAMKK